MPRKHSLHEVRDSADRIYEVYAPSQKEALRLARYRVWAMSPSHVGIRRILRTIPGEQWPVLDNEASYITVLRDGAEKKRAREELLTMCAGQAPDLAARRRAAEDAAFAVRLAKVRANMAAGLERRLALDARLGRHRPIPSLPTYDPFINQWV